MLDSPFFYFTPIDNNLDISEKNAAIKRNIYYLAKLNYANAITDGAFTAQLAHIRNSGRFNSDYLKLDDGMFSQIAVFIQALGRIERVWQPMETQTIRLSQDIYNLLENFVTSPNCGSIKQDLKKYFSNNLLVLFEKIEKDARKRKNIISLEKEEHLKSINDRCYQSIRQLLNNLNTIRTNKQHPKSKAIRKEWNDLRIAALKHQFHKDDLVAKNNGVFETGYYDANNGALYINKNLDIVPANLQNADYHKWTLDSIYNIIKENKVVRGHFELKGFELGFNNHRRFFTPYFFSQPTEGNPAYAGLFLDSRPSTPNKAFPI